MPNRLRRHPVGAALLILVLAVLAADQLGWLPRPAGGDYERYDGLVAGVVRVIDGDTLDIDFPDGDESTTRVRLWGVDAPETRGADVPLHFGPQALDFARDFVSAGPVRIELSPVDSRDRYDRLLGYVYRTQDNVMLNEALLSSGHAYADPRFDHEFKDRFLRLEKEARSRSAGLWADVTPDQLPRWRRGRPPSR